MEVNLPDVRAARERVRDVAIRTPILPLKFSDRVETYVKCENLQRGGAFKIRGAFNKISRLRGVKGVTAYSSGNHAQAVALAARMRGLEAAIVMLDQSVPHKVEQTKAYGARVILGGRTSEEIRERSVRLGREEGLAVIPPFDDPEIIAGQGTIGLEILEDLPGAGAVLVPIGGGGLSSGVAIAIKESAPRVKVIGVEPEGAAKMYESRRAGRLVTLPGTDTIADGLKPVRGGELTFSILSRLLDDLVLVSDEEILDAARHLLLKEKLVVEPSGAASLAALRSGRARLPEGQVVAVLSGGNADLSLLLPGRAETR